MKQRYNFIDESGNRYVRLFVLSKAGRNEHRKTLWLCLCDCGTEKTIIGDSLRNGRTQSCGCLQRELASKRYKGENGSNWQGGISSENELLRASSEYKQWRTSVFERDNYTCQMCGDDKGGNLEAHHLFPFSDYDILRLEVYNGQTLCKDCHNFTKGQELIHRIVIVQNIFSKNKCSEVI